MKSIILIAPPAAGKGTQSKLIEEKFGFAHISTGDLLRQAAKTDALLAEKMKTGYLIDDEVTLKLLSERIIQKDCLNGYVLDGFPRNIKQAQAYDKLLTDMHLDLGKVIVLMVDKEEARRRIVGRLVCSNCGVIYSDMVKEQMPKQKGVCDKCHHPLFKRSDDSDETFNIRFETYLKETAPIIDYYKNNHHVYYINSIDSKVTFDQITKIINEWE